MNRNQIVILVSFVSGFVTGGVVTFFSSKKYFQKREKTEQDLYKEYYKVADKYKRTEDDTTNDEDTEPDLTKSEMKEKLRMNREKPLIDYSSMYNQSKSFDQGEIEELLEEAAESEHPVDSNEDEGLLTNELLAEEAHDRHQNVMSNVTNVKPRIISIQAVGDLPPETDHRTLEYYTEDGVLCEEDSQEPIDSPEQLIGDALEKYGFADNGEDCIFVYNASIDTCYEITKIRGWFSQDEGGYAE